MVPQDKHDAFRRLDAGLLSKYKNLFADAINKELLCERISGEFCEYCFRDMIYVEDNPGICNTRLVKYIEKLPENKISAYSCINAACNVEDGEHPHACRIWCRNLQICDVSVSPQNVEMCDDEEHLVWKEVPFEYIKSDKPKQRLVPEHRIIDAFRQGVEAARASPSTELYTQKTGISNGNMMGMPVPSDVTTCLHTDLDRLREELTTAYRIRDSAEAQAQMALIELADLREAQKWLPIETADRLSTTTVDIWVVPSGKPISGGYRIPNCLPCYEKAWKSSEGIGGRIITGSRSYDEAGNLVLSPDDVSENAVRATHWMPIPPAPTEDRT